MTDLATPNPTVEETIALTRVTVDAADLTVAFGVIEVKTGCTAESQLRNRDARLISLAVMYQAAWEKSQVDALGRQEVVSLSQDGQSVSYPQATPGEPEGMVLAPLAHQCLNRLSWRRSKSVAIRGESERVRPAFASGFTTDEDGWDEADWTPLATPADDPNTFSPLGKGS